MCTEDSRGLNLVSGRGRSRVSAAASLEKKGELTASVTAIPTQASPPQTSNRTGSFILAGFLLAGAVVFFLVQRWKQSQNRLIKKGEAPIEGPWLWNSGVASHRQPSVADIERARKKRADERGGRQLRPVFVAEGQLPPEGTDPEAVIEIPRNHPWATADLDDVPIDVLQRRLDQRRGPPDQAHETWRKIQQESARLEENFEEVGATETDLEWAESRRRRKAQLQDVAASRMESPGDRQ